MNLKPLVFVFASIVVIGVAGFAKAGNDYLANPNPETVLSLTSAQLALSPAQQDKLRPLLKRAAALRADIRSQAEPMRAASRVELNRPDANLRALRGERQALVTREFEALNAVRNQLLTFYEDELNSDQQAKARQLLLKRMNRFDQMRERLMAVSDAGAFAP